MKLPLREKRQNTEFFLVRIILYYGNTGFSPNTGKYGPEKTPDLDTFHAGSFELDMLWGNGFFLVLFQWTCSGESATVLFSPSATNLDVK